MFAPCPQLVDAFPQSGVVLRHMLTVSAKIAALPLFLFLPGWLLLDLFLPVSGRKGLKTVFLEVLTSILVTSGVSLALADFGLFSLGTLTSTVLAVCVAAGAIRKIRRIPLFVRPSVAPGFMMVGAIVAVMCILYGRPHEDIGGGWDPGVCLQTGAGIARTGGVNYRDEFFASLPDAEKELFLHVRRLPQRFPGFRIVDMESGLISPQFYHLYPCWLAIAHEIGGVRAMLYVNPLFASLALLAVYLAAATLLDRRTGLMACVLLAGNVIQIWFARFSTAEILTQYLVWSGLYMFGLHTRERGAGYGILCAVCFGTAFLVRITAVMVIPAVVLVLLHRLLLGEWRKDWALAAVLGLYFIAGLLHNRLVATAYFDLPGHLAYLLRRYRPAVLLAGCAAASLACFGARGRLFLSRLLKSGWIRNGLSLLVLGVAVYAYFIRPGLVARGQYAAGLSGDMLRRLLSDSSAFREMAWFVTFPGLWLAVGGCVVMLRQRIDSGRALLLLVTLTMAWFFFRGKMIEPFYMFTLRRFVPVVVPALAVFAAFSVSRISRDGGKAGRAIAWIIVGLLVLAPLWKGRRVVRQVDFKGMVRTCGDLARSSNVPAGAPVICDGYWLAAPLHFFHGWNTLAISDPTHEKYRRAMEAAERWLSEGMSVYYLTHGARPFTKELDFEPCTETKFGSTRLEHAIQRYPDREVPRCVNIGLFRVDVAKQPRELPPSVEIPVGWHFFGIGRGLLPATRIADRDDEASGMSVPRMQRRIDGASDMVIPWNGARTALSLCIDVHCSGSGTLPSLAVYVEGRRLETVSLRSGQEEYRVMIPKDEAGTSCPGRADLRLELLDAAEVSACRVFLESVRLESGASAESVDSAKPTRAEQANGVNLEYWSVGVMGCLRRGGTVSCPTTPVLQHSSTPDATQVLL